MERREDSSRRSNNIGGSSRSSGSSSGGRRVVQACAGIPFAPATLVVTRQAYTYTHIHASTHTQTQTRAVCSLCFKAKAKGKNTRVGEEGCLPPSISLYLSLTSTGDLRGTECMAREERGW